MSAKTQKWGEEEKNKKKKREAYMTRYADTDEWKIPIYPIHRKPIPLLFFIALTAASIYGILSPFLKSGTFTRDCTM